MMSNIPKNIDTLEREPTVEEIGGIASSIYAIVGKFAKLEPAIIIEDYQKKALFLKSLPPCCDAQIQMIQSTNPYMTCNDFIQRWMASKQTIEFKTEARGDEGNNTKAVSLYSSDHTGGGGKQKGQGSAWGGRGGGGRQTHRDGGGGGRYGSGGRYGDGGRYGNSYARGGGRGQGRSRVQGRGYQQPRQAGPDDCYYCGKPNHREADCRFKKWDMQNGKLRQSNSGNIAQDASTTSDDQQLSLQIPQETIEASDLSRMHSLLVMQVTNNQTTPVTIGDHGDAINIFKHKRTEFIIDSGATVPVTPHHAAITNAREHLTEITVGNGTVAVSNIIGDMGGITNTRVLEGVPATIVLISVFTHLGYDVIFGARMISLKRRASGRRILFAAMQDGRMTVQVSHFQGVYFEEDLTDDDLPPLAYPDSSDDDDDYLRNENTNDEVIRD
jgi:hypothetical protein